MDTKVMHRPVVLAHPQVSSITKGHLSWGKLHSKALIMARRGSQHSTRGIAVMASAAKKVLVPVANGSEEIEAVICSVAQSFRITLAPNAISCSVHQ